MDQYVAEEKQDIYLYWLVTCMKKTVTMVTQGWGLGISKKENRQKGNIIIYLSILLIC